MDLDQRINAFAKLGEFLTDFISNSESKDYSDRWNSLSQEFNTVINQAKLHNAWFTNDQVYLALNSWSKALSQNNLKKWMSTYSAQSTQDKKRVAIIMAGNLPLVGFHDLLSILITGHYAIAKLSSDDRYLMPFLAKVLTEIDPYFEDKIHFTEEKLPDFDAVIATGSNNTARYFEYYFKDKPHIIRKNRNAIAILDGSETNQQLEGLADDIFKFYGMGCRSVSKVYIPQEYDLDTLFKALYSYQDYTNHNKYINNYDYNKAVYLMSLAPVLDNGFIVLKEDPNFSSPIAVLFYERYTIKSQLKQKLDNHKDEIQCIVAHNFSENEIAFGKAQQPKLWDYADGVDTIAFLLKI